ncbi:hypothetical protein IU469_31805 [Nocardia puris]|uniref:Uncharacterized protein n=1 Tax=Nocardia puris TaxID=208602 RepID=A0A366CVF6_9NOCA|nr:hypothetical protein [Nocardia puris]MBF6215993.1 hypothetical protein [Nocardia puris]MBF6370257.1 hypothetical protein [Nocardia puris]RBO80099.1 hypothetical protein DFR74_12816 [Nocardia puris]
MLFDIRTIVGALLGLYAVVLVITGLVHDTAAEEAKTGGINVNIWAGLGMGAVSVAFFAWVLLRPVVPAEPPARSDDEKRESGDSSGL